MSLFLPGVWFVVMSPLASSFLLGQSCHLTFIDSNCNAPPAGRARATGTRKQMPSACKLIAWITEEGTRTWAKSLGLWLRWIVHKPSSYYLCTSTQRLFIHTDGNRMASILLTRSRTPLMKTSRSLKNEFRKGNTVFFFKYRRAISMWLIALFRTRFEWIIVILSAFLFRKTQRALWTVKCASRRTDNLQAYRQ